MRKIYYITTIIAILIVSFLGITYSFEYTNEETLTFELIGPSTFYHDVNTEYTEYGIKVTHNNIDVSSKVKIDTSNLDISHLGEYKVKYEYQDEYIYRNVIVIDKISPAIELIGGNEVYILLNGNYEEAGYNVTDNYDTNLKDKVIVKGNVNVNKEGIYEITYSVTDNSGNKTSVIRKVIVKKSVITVENETTTRVTETAYNATLYSNTIIKNSFNPNGIYYEGYVQDSSDSYQIKFKSRTSNLEYLYNMNSNKDHYYSGNMRLTSLTNGTYDVYIISKKEERLMNKLYILSKIVRAKVGNKLVTITYDNDNVSITIEDFNYQYDIVIDPGHGGTDTGAANGIITEKNLNLKVSKYEKCRYESMGYRVYMVRYNDSYGEMLGNSSIEPVDRRALTLGYYGAVSKVTYSNHHNGSKNTSASGFEILVSNQITANDLYPEISLYNKYKKFYNINDNNVRIYSKNYLTNEIYNKANGEVYSYKNYYAVIRIPYELFNVKNVIYEPIYMTNSNDFNWYYSGNNWQKVSELKIEEYVKFIGGKYNSDNKNCL